MSPMGTGSEINDIATGALEGMGVSEGDGVLVAFSGGPDSLCLLDALSKTVSAGRLRINLSACHIDHMLRPCSGSDAEFCRSFCNERGIAFDLRREDVGATAAERGQCIEEAARDARYQLLEECARDCGARFVATGHNRDDQAETVLMRILRGTGLAGLAAIKPSRPIRKGCDIVLVRPILEAGRKDIISYLKENGLAYLTDETNADTSYLRNRIRAELLPLLEERYSPAIRETLARLAASAGTAGEHIEILANEAFHEAVIDKTNESVSLDATKLQTAGGFMLYEILKRAFKHIGLDGLLTSGRFEPIANALEEGKTSGRLQVGEGASAEFQNGRLLVTRLPFPERREDWEVRLHAPCAARLEEPGFEMTCEIVERGSFDMEAFKAAKSTLEEALDAEKTGAALAVRPARNGDRFRPLGLGGSKKVADFLTDLKVPLRRKFDEVVLTAGGEIAWLVGRRIDGRFAVTDGTSRVLLCRIDKNGDADG